MFNLNLASVFIQVDFSSCMSIHMVRNDVRQGDKYKSAHFAKTRPKSKQSEGFLCLFNLNYCNEELLDLTLSSFRTILIYFLSSGCTTSPEHLSRSQTRVGSLQWVCAHNQKLYQNLYRCQARVAHQVRSGIM